jgi:hypothetical protein
METFNQLLEMYVGGNTPLHYTESLHSTSILPTWRCDRAPRKGRHLFSPASVGSTVHGQLQKKGLAIKDIQDDVEEQG